MLRSSVLRSMNAVRPVGVRSAHARVQLLGNIVADITPESVQQGASGKQFLRYTVAVSSSPDYPAEFFDVTAFNENQFPFLTTYVKQGDKVLVEGYLKKSKYTTEDGTNRYTTNIIQRLLEKLGSKRTAPYEEA